MMKAYASDNVLLLPPRAPGETLPPELLDFYREQTTQKPEEGGSPAAFRAVSLRSSATVFVKLFVAFCLTSDGKISVAFRVPRAKGQRVPGEGES